MPEDWGRGRGGAWSPGVGAGPGAQGSGQGRGWGWSGARGGVGGVVGAAPGAGGGARRAGLALSALRGGCKEPRRHGRQVARRGLRAARRQVKPGERVGGSCCPAVLSPGASGPQTGSGPPGRLRNIQGLAAGGVCLFRAGQGRELEACSRRDVRTRNNFTQRSYSKFPVLLLSRRRLPSDESPRTQLCSHQAGPPVPQGVNPGSAGKLHLLAPFSSLPGLAGS